MFGKRLKARIVVTLRMVSKATVFRVLLIICLVIVLSFSTANIPSFWWSWGEGDEPLGSFDGDSIQQDTIGHFIDLDALLAAEFRKLREGRILFNPSDEMKQGEKERVEVRITKYLTVDLQEGLKGSGRPITEAIKVGSFMEAILKGDAFKITRLSSDQQVLPPGDFAQWAWDVVPLESGSHSLQLLISVRLKSPEFGEETYSHPVLEREIKVEVSPYYVVATFLASYWHWIVATLLLPGVVWLIKNHRNARRSRVRLRRLP